MLISDFLLLVVENVCALTLICDQDLIKQKVKIIDFKTICNSLDYEQTFNFQRIWTSTKILRKIMTFQKLPKTHFSQYLVFFIKITL